MVLKLEKQKPAKYTISEESGKIMYICEKKISLLGNKIFIYDENNLQLAEIKEKALSKEKYIIYINGTEFDNVIVCQKTPLEKYQLTNKAWIIEGDITYTDYKVIDEKEQVAMTMKCNLIDTNIWDININTEEKLLASTIIMIILSIAKK